MEERRLLRLAPLDQLGVPPATDGDVEPHSLGREPVLGRGEQARRLLRVAARRRHPGAEERRQRGSPARPLGRDVRRAALRLAEVRLWIARRRGPHGERRTPAELEHLDADELHAKEERLRERVPATDDARIRGARLPFVEIDLRLREHVEEVRKMRPLRRPVGDRVVGLPARDGRVAAREPGDRQDPRAELCHRVAVAALGGFLEERRDAPAQLLQLPQVHHRAERVEVHAVEREGLAGAPLAEERRRLRAELVRLLPSPLEEGRDARAGERPGLRERRRPGSAPPARGRARRSAPCAPRSASRPWLNKRPPA